MAARCIHMGQTRRESSTDRGDKQRVIERHHVSVKRAEALYHYISTARRRSLVLLSMCRGPPSD